MVGSLPVFGVHVDSFKEKEKEHCSDFIDVLTLCPGLARLSLQKKVATSILYVRASEDLVPWAIHCSLVTCNFRDIYIFVGALHLLFACTSVLSTKIGRFSIFTPPFRRSLQLFFVNFSVS